MQLAQVTAGALVAVAVLAGCSSKEPANDTLPTAAPASAEPTLPPLGPPDLPMPVEARERSAAGVEAFTRYYVELINRLQRDLDSSYLRSLSQDCETCDRIASDAERDAAAGYTYQGGALTVASIGSASVQDQSAEIAFTVNQAPLTVLDPDGRPIDELSAPELTQLPAGLSTRWDVDHWLISSLSFG